jgi:hypothetical protein
MLRRFTVSLWHAFPQISFCVAKPLGWNSRSPTDHTHSSSLLWVCIADTQCTTLFSSFHSPSHPLRDLEDTTTLPRCSQSCVHIIMLTDFLFFLPNLSLLLAMILVWVHSCHEGACLGPLFIEINPEMNVFEGILSAKVCQPPTNTFVCVCCHTYPCASSHEEKLCSLCSQQTLPKVEQSLFYIWKLPAGPTAWSSTPQLNWSPEPTTKLHFIDNYKQR